ncbi:MAG: pyruvate kinase [Candidatus Neomarinimicrobiota bacterium]
MKNKKACRKTKTVVTIGPASCQPETMRRLLTAGMDVARINTSHTDRQGLINLVSSLRAVAADEGCMLGILLDLAGPKIRVADLPAKGRHLAEGEVLTLGTGNDADIKIRPAVAFQAVEENARVMLDDGRIELRVVAHESSSLLRIEVVYGGHLKANKGVNFPGVALGVPSLTTRDKENLRLGLEQDVDWIALSFVRSPDDRQAIDEVFSDAGRWLPVMAKIEKPEAVARLDEIIQVFDGIMVARGDLGVEMPLEEVPLIQKRIIRQCNAAGKPVITATQLLDSMVSEPSPTRAEVNDVANAIYDGTDAVMLSNETAIGTYPVKAVETLHAIAITTEAATAHTDQKRRQDYSIQGVSASISHGACNIAHERGIPVIVTMTHTGSTARSVSRFRPNSRIVALSPFTSTCRQLQLSWGITPLQVEEYASTDEMIAKAERLLLEKEFVRPGDYFVLTAGVPIGQPGTTNLLKVQQVGQN